MFHSSKRFFQEHFLMLTSFTLQSFFSFMLTSIYFKIRRKKFIHFFYLWSQFYFRYNRIMIFFSIGFLITAWMLSHLFGSVGFILANCCNMGARIIYRYLNNGKHRNFRYLNICLKFFVFQFLFYSTKIS